MPEGVAMPDRLDRLTADAQTALSFAQEEALRFNQKYVGTEHILLGLLRQDNGPAAKLLRSLGVDMDRLPAAVRSHMERGYRSVYDELPLTPGAEKTIALAFDEARRLRSKTVGAEHPPPEPARIIDGRAIAQEVRAEVARRARRLARRGVTPGLALILVGDNPSSASYVRSKGNAAEEAGIFSETFHLSDTISQDELTSRILDVEEDPRFHALLVQLPLPPRLDEATAVNALDPTKDVDGVTAVNLGRLLRGEPCPPPATPAGVDV